MGCSGGRIPVQASSAPDTLHQPTQAVHARLRLHPGAGGARVLAELMIHPLAAAVEEVAAGVQVEEREDPRLQGLPPPMIPHSPNISSSSCYMLVRGPSTVIPCSAGPHAAGPMPPIASGQSHIQVCLAGTAHAGGVQAAGQSCPGLQIPA